MICENFSTSHYQHVRFFTGFFVEKLTFFQFFHFFRILDTSSAFNLFLNQNYHILIEKNWEIILKKRKKEQLKVNRARWSRFAWLKGYCEGFWVKNQHFWWRTYCVAYFQIEHAPRFSLYSPVLFGAGNSIGNSIGSLARAQFESMPHSISYSQCC